MFLNVPEIFNPFASKEIKEKQFLFTCNGAKYGQIQLGTIQILRKHVLGDFLTQNRAKWPISEPKPPHTTYSRNIMCQK